MKKLTITTAAALTALAAFSHAGGGYVFEGRWGRWGYGNGEFGHLHHVAVASDGTVYVADPWRSRIQYFTSTGSFLGKWGKSGYGPGEFRAPFGVAVAPDGNVYVACTYMN